MKNLICRATGAATVGSRGDAQMNLRPILLICLACTVGLAVAQDQASVAEQPVMARVGSMGFLKVQVHSFAALSPRQQTLAYWLAQAAIAIDPIIYDQLSAYGLREKRVLDEIQARPAGIAPQALRKITDYTELFWANTGNHDLGTAQKFLPPFTFEELRSAALTAQHNGAMQTPYGDLPALRSAKELDQELSALRRALFDAKFEPMITAKSPPAGMDIIQASSNTFYPNLSLADLTGFKDRYALNSRVVKDAQGQLHELVYRAGTPDGRVTPGLYALYLRRAVDYLQRAQDVAQPAQAQVIADLIRYYRTGEFQDWLRFDRDWVRDDAAVDFSNGFVEVYRDARGMKGSAAAFVSITDRALTSTMSKLAANAGYFEQRAPWDPRYKKQSFSLPVIKAVETLVETGDYNVTTIGDNLPNENEVREKYGSKNFLIVSSSRGFYEADPGHKTDDEFLPDAPTIARRVKYGEEADELFTALHEVIGHGSGKLSPRLSGGAEPELKEYFSTLEEARADLMALWNVWDPKLQELGLSSNQEEVAKAMYDEAMSYDGLQQLFQIPAGDSLEEDHARDRQLIVNFIIDTSGGVERFKRNGKSYIRVSDYHKARAGVGKLLAELMRIKAEGDYAAIKQLVDKYGVHFDPALRDEVVARFAKLDLPVNWAGINARLTAKFDATGAVQSVQIDYPQDVAGQFLNYAAMYDPGLARK
jgi:dipeptidyl-peptidase III